jgi:chloramphenicol-sensitive protein RarD
MDKTEQRKGFAHALLAHLLWGVLPLYFKLVILVSPWEVLANRILWTLGLILLILAVRGEMRSLLLALRTPRLLAALTASGIFIATSWLIYIWAVANDHIVAVSLGYFLSPLINVLLGVAVLRERLSRNQWLAIGIAAAGVAILAAEAPETFGISLTVAIAFALYGLVRKTTPVAPLVGLGVETLVLVLPAIGLLLWVQRYGGLAFGGADDITLLLIASGVITSAPLLLFASAARRLTLVTNGLLQFVSPTMQFLLGVLAFGEPMSPERWASFALIWAALALFVWQTLSRRRSSSTA